MTSLPTDSSSSLLFALIVQLNVVQATFTCLRCSIKTQSAKVLWTGLPLPPFAARYQNIWSQEEPRDVLARAAPGG